MIAPGLLVLRLVLATVLVAHGGHTLFGAFAGPGSGPGGLTNASAHFASLGFSAPFLLAVLTGGFQFGGGLLIAVGYFTRWVTIGLALLQGLEIWKDSARWGFFLNWTADPTRGHGMEYGLVLGATFVCLALAGAGEWSIDGIRARSAASRALGRARLRDRV
jgi:putative oxidoreductase